MKVYSGNLENVGLGVRCDWVKPVVLWCDDELKFDESLAKFEIWGCGRKLIEYESDDSVCLFLEINENLNEFFNDGENYTIWKRWFKDGIRYYQILIENGGRVSITKFPISWTKEVWQNCWFENYQGVLRKFWSRCVFKSEFLARLEAERQ